MTREEKRILIAQDQGIPKHARFYAMNHGGMQYWNYRSREDADRLWTLFGDEEYPVEDFWMVEWLPDYFGCLNEMHKAENAFRHPSDFYQSTLAEVCGGGRNRIYRATAAERAEAYGLARGLWKEGE